MTASPSEADINIYHLNNHLRVRVHVEHASRVWKVPAHMRGGKMARKYTDNTQITEGYSAGTDAGAAVVR